jgi:hypothetical protein
MIPYLFDSAIRTGDPFFSMGIYGIGVGVAGNVGSKGGERGQRRKGTS